MKYTVDDKSPSVKYIRMLSNLMISFFFAEKKKTTPFPVVLSCSYCLTTKL